MEICQWRLCSSLLMLVGLLACQKIEPQVSRPIPLPIPLPQDSLVQVYFNRSPATEYTEPYRQITRSGDNLEQLIAAAITSAQSTVDVAVQELRLPKIAQALVERHQAGIKVRVILENNYSRPWSDLSAAEVAKLKPRERQRYNEALKLIDSNGNTQLSQDEINQADALVILRNAKVPMIDDTADGSKGSGLMHHKFLVIDGRLSIVTSANFTTSGIHGDSLTTESRGNTNNLLKIDSPDLAKLLLEEFNLMWGDGPGGKADSKFGINKPSRQVQQVQLGDTNISVHFSPTSATKPWSQSSNGLIGKTLTGATKSIDLALFVFSEQRLANLLETSHQQGIEIRALIDSGFAYRNYSEALDLMGVALSKKCQYEDGNRPWQNPITTIGVTQLPKGDLLHHKFAIIDGQTVITGSQNWSWAANTNNDETVLVINNPTVAAHFQREFESLYAKVVLGIPMSLGRKIKAQQQKCPP